MSYEISLQKLLETTDKDLYGRLAQIEKMAKPLLSYTQGNFPYYTPHDFHHSLTVEENLNWLILDKVKEQLNKYEIFFLICAAWLHDWGMVGTEDEIPDKIRKDHHIRTETYFETHYSKLGFTFHEGRIIGRICKGHRKVDLHSEEYEDMTFEQGIRIRTRFLAALLRIADEADITHSRTPEVIYYSINPSAKSKEEFEKHLNITGIGQLDEPHKIYITAIARDPKGAKALRELTYKIQQELNTVKNILSQNGLNLDVVELKLETRGFIDKPIGFEINKHKIVDLLIGKHLYGKLDVSIRELVQNAIDACNFKKISNNSFAPLISLVRKDDSTLTISDNGIGMSYGEAKRFLSNIGTSFYNSDDFLKTVQDKPYDPISFFGIGLLSTFLIAESLIIETKKDNEDTCLFTISSFSDEWRYEKGTSQSSGTKITLTLNDEGKKINIKESLSSYFIVSDIPIAYKEINEDETLFETTWSKNAVVENFMRHDFNEELIKADSICEVISLDKSEYNVILTQNKTHYYWGSQLVLFNHGVFVKCIEIDGLDYDYNIFLNLKANLIDLHISREDIVKNKKWNLLLSQLSDDILDKAKELYSESEYISFVSDIIENRIIFENFDREEISESTCFLRSILDKMIFPIFENNSLGWVHFDEILRFETFSIFACNSRDYMNEISFICEGKFQTEEDRILFYPYKMPKVREENKDLELDILYYLFDQNKLQYKKCDLRTVLLKSSVPIKDNYEKILPRNVHLTSFGKLKPLFVVKEYPKYTCKNNHLGAAYWGNILLWKQLIAEDRRSVYLEALGDSLGREYESVRIAEEPIVLIDATDTFIASIINKYQSLTSDQCEMVYRYFKYISYLPLVLYNMESCLIFIEVIENIEDSISKSIGISRPQELFTRMQSNSSLYLQYYTRNGMNYIKI